MLCNGRGGQWDVAWEECEARDGFVIHGEKQLTFAELALEAAELSPPDPPPLRSMAAAEAPNQRDLDVANCFPAPRPALQGRWSLPVRRRRAAARHGLCRDPPRAARPRRAVAFDKAAAAGTPGLVGVVKGKRWIAAVAGNWWAAERALDRLRPRFRVARPLDSAAIEEALETALTQRRSPARYLARRGRRSDGRHRRTLARYDVSAALHATIETASAAARYENGRLELWIASQAPEQARLAAAKALGIAESDVVLYPMPAGGSFDRRLEHDHAIEVALIARAIGRPVQLVWSRWQEALAGRPRTPVAAVSRRRRVMTAMSSAGAHGSLCRRPRRSSAAACSAT